MDFRVDLEYVGVDFRVDVFLVFLRLTSDTNF